MKQRLKTGGLFLLIGITFLFGGHSAFGSRFALFALDVQVTLAAGQSTGKAREAAIAKGLRQAVEEATFKLIPQEGFGTNYVKLQSEIFNKADRFVPQYKILSEKQYPGTFDISLQVTVDLVLLRHTLTSLGAIRAEKGKEKIGTSPSFLIIKNLTRGTALMAVMGFFSQRPDLVEHFSLIEARHGTFTFRFFPMETLDTITSQILYHAPIHEGTFKVLEQAKNRLVLSYQPVSNP